MATGTSNWVDYLFMSLNTIALQVSCNYGYNQIKWEPYCQPGCTTLQAEPILKEEQK